MTACIRSARSLVAAVVLAGGLWLVTSGAPDANAVVPGTNGRIAFLRDVGSSDQRFQAFAVDADGSNLQQITDEVSSLTNFAWTTDGRRLHYTLPYGLHLSVAPDGSDRRWGEDYGFEQADSPDGTRRVYASGTDIRERLATNTGDRYVTSLLEGTPWAPRYSPDGTKIVFEQYISHWPEDPHPTGRVHIVNSDGTGLTAIGPADKWNTSPTFSPDGTQIAFIRWGLDADEWGRLWVMDADGSHARQVVDGPAREIDWQPLGRDPLPTTTSTSTTTTTTTPTTTTTTAVPNVAPTAIIGVGRSPGPLTVTVNAGASTDADGAVISYTWKWGDNTPPTNTQSATHRYAKTGEYQVRLIVTDDRGAKTAAEVWVKVK